jgi:predicted HicB family RNase H-like nuclease
VSATPKPRGRPPNPPGAGKLERIELRTTTQRKAKLRRLASAAGLNLNEWIERQIDEALEDS